MLVTVKTSMFKRYANCKHIRSAVVGLAHALGGKHMAGLCCVIIVQNKSKLTLTEAHTILLHGVRSEMPK